MKKINSENMEDEFLCFGILVSILLRWLVSIYPYSGAGQSPMFGDYEAQRHWMEITWNLPISEWYYNSTQNDLMYWGLDYPPLTAYHSWINGFVSNKINSSWVSLHSSRGHESYDHKLFMRYSVLISDLIIYIPAVLAYWKYIKPSLRLRDKAVAVTTMLLYPGLYLIDYGHFQYNCVSIGLTLWAIVALSSHRELVASVLFSLALSYKQMELYHAFPFFFYLLGKAWWGKENCVIKVTKLGLVVLSTFAVCWLPFLPHMPQVLHRLFPLARGIFEDKVASFWCSINILIKFRNIVSLSNLAALSAVLTFIMVLPSSVHLFVRNNFETFKLSLVNVSLSFFIFSFHVHEKSILLVAMPVCLLMEDHPVSSIWFLLISIFSMFPLLLKDGLVIPYFALFALYFVGCYMGYLKRFFKRDDVKSETNWFKSLILPFSMGVSLFGAVLLSVAYLTVSAPGRYPDLYPVLISLYSFVHFALFLLYFYYIQFTKTSGTVIFTKIKTK